MAAQDRRTHIFIDSHAHLADAAFSSDRDAVISRARAAGVEAIVCIGESLEAAGVAAKLAAQYPGYIYSTAGIHPHDALAFDADRDVSGLRAQLGGGAVAVGECGLDFHYDNSPRDAQLRAFATQLDLAAEVGRPVVVHTRDAEADTALMIDRARELGVKGVLHCYTGSQTLAHHALNAGWYISFSGIVTFKKWTDDELLRLVPEDRLLVESDAPYLAPVPFRGKRNEPAWVGKTLAKLAAARRVTPDTLGRTTSENARRLFGLAVGAAP